MSDICLEYFGNGIEAISASARNLSPIKGLLNRKDRALLDGLASVRNAVLPMRSELRSMLKEQPCLDEASIERGKKVDLVHLCKLSRAIITALETTNSELTKRVHGNAIMSLYHRFLLSRF